MNNFFFILVVFFPPLFLHAAEEEKEKIDTPRYSKLHEQAILGETQKVAILLGTGNQVNAQTPSGYTPLHSAITNKENLETQGCLETVNLLLQEKADVNAKAKNGVTPLWLATHYTLNPTLIKILLESKADPNVVVTWQIQKKNKKTYSRFSTPFLEIFRSPSAHTEEIAALFLSMQANPTVEDDQKESALAKALPFPTLVKKMLTSPHMTQDAVIGARLAAMTKKAKNTQERKKIQKSEKLLEKYQKSSPAPSPKSVIKQVTQLRAPTREEK